MYAVGIFSQLVFILAYFILKKKRNNEISQTF